MSHPVLTLIMILKYQCRIVFSFHFSSTSSGQNVLLDNVNAVLDLLLLGDCAFY